MSLSERVCGAGDGGHAHALARTHLHVKRHFRLHLVVVRRRCRAGAAAPARMQHVRQRRCGRQGTPVVRVGVQVELIVLLLLVWVLLRRMMRGMKMVLGRHGATTPSCRSTAA